MNGLLKEKSEIKKLQEEFKILTGMGQKETSATKNKEKKQLAETCEL